MGKIISIANQKGGVGKTTTAINLAASIALAGKDILIVDTDPQCNATSGVGIEKESIDKSIYDIYLSRQSVEDVIVKTPYDNLHLLPGTIDILAVEIELINMEGREKILARSLEAVKERFEYTFIDCPPSLGLLTLNALTASDSVLVPVQCEYYALEGLGMLTRTLELVKNTFNHKLEIEGILLTMNDSRNTLSRQVEEEVRKYFGKKVYKVVIPRNVSLGEAPGHGKPVLFYDIKSKGAQSYMSLAREFIG